MEARGIISATNTAPYASTPPSEPFIYIPHRQRSELQLNPAVDNAAAMKLTPEEYNLITSDKRPQLAADRNGDWDYSQRRRAHAILDWLYLGPFTVIRDQKFLSETGITTIIPVRFIPDPNVRNIYNNIGSNSVTRELGIAVDPVDVQNDFSLPGIFPLAVKKINDHILAHAHAHPVLNPQNGGMRHNAKVLVICETGNHRSALIVAAYLAAMFDLSLSETLGYISMRRFSADLDDAWKRYIHTWIDILQAKRDVNSSVSCVQPTSSHKRSIDDTSDEDMQDVPQGSHHPGQDDYGDRRKFVPFVDAEDSLD